VQPYAPFGPLFTGRLLRLSAPAPDDHALFARWSEQDGYQRGFDNDPARPISAEAHAEWERPFLQAPNSFIFRLRTLDDDRLIGVGALGDVQWVHRTAMLGLAIGDPDYRGRGYGSDAVQLLLRYAFEELNLSKVWLSTIAFNVPAQRTFERAGFVREGVQRSMIERDGRRFDLLLYGLLRQEWLSHPSALPPEP
jgi:RimJ/RimL family protein N-acetyltransferase